MTNSNNCGFCTAGIRGLMESVPLKSATGDFLPCKRGIYEDQYCVATLAPEQYTRGHAIVVLKRHRADITDVDLSETELAGFIIATNRVAKHLKQAARNDEGESPKRIYVCSLCDGVEHLHAHLIPRYPFMDSDRDIYKSRFLPRDGEAKIQDAIKSDELGGFWYVAEREQNYAASEYGRKSNEEKAKSLQALAQQLRMSMF